MKGTVSTPLQFTPINQNFSFEPITVPNKNISSYFMRNEQSYLTPESVKYPAYIDSSSTVCITLGNKYFYIEDAQIEQDCIVNDRLNVEKYGSRQKCLDHIYTLLYNEIKIRNKNNTFEGAATESTAETSSAPALSSSAVESVIGLDSKVILIFNDFMCRSDIVASIDLVLNSLGFKCIMLLPLSLCLSFNLNQCYSAFVYKNGFSFIDDFCLIDSFDYVQRSEKYAKILIDDVDFAEEFSRLDVLEESMVFSCDECGAKEDTEEKILAHTMKEHKSGSFFKFDVQDARKPFEETFKDRMRFLFKKELLEKVGTKVYSVDCEFPEAECLENVPEQALSGTRIFSNLEISKELWMTDAEWRTGRLRVLKEKLLFYI